MKSRVRSYNVNCGEFTVLIPSEYKAVWTDLYFLQVGTTFHALYRTQGDSRIRPRDPKLHFDETQLSRVQYGGRVYDIKLGGYEMAIATGVDDRDPEALADQISYETKRRASVRRLGVNGIKAAVHGRFSGKFGHKTWWFKKGTTMLHIYVKGFGLPSPKTRKAISWIVNHIE